MTSEIADNLEVYFELLSKWNAAINLTALPLDPPSEAAVDRLFVEPLAASIHLPPTKGGIWFDLGSGGGSPALPLRVAAGPRRLTMVEAKTRKAAFLREAARAMALGDASVENARFEDLSKEPSAAGLAELVTIRAVRIDSATEGATARLLGPGGHLLLFGSSNSVQRMSGFEHQQTVQLVQIASDGVSAVRESYLSIYRHPTSGGAERPAAV